LATFVEGRMHKIHFFPLGNADCLRIDLEAGRQVLFDYANMRAASDKNDKRIDLPKVLRENLDAQGRDYYDVVAFTHLDDDHCCGAGEFFYLEHAEKYQGDDRIKINELWVPAAAIIEEGCEDDSRIIRQEARHRLRTGKGIRVFSRPEKLAEWLEDNGLSLAEREHLISDAGTLVPGFGKAADGVEFFVHSPMASRLADGSLIDRNLDSIVLHATFSVFGVDTKVLLTSDITHETIKSIVEMTKARGREARLEWDVVDLPHHCSYLGIGPEKGEEKTEPTPEVKWLYEDKALWGGRLISPSWPIPANDDDAQPPHRQAANYYRERARAVGGEFLVMMEHPSEAAPEPLVIEIDSRKARVVKRTITGAAAVVTHRTPRAG
jgi:hypothetical protein